MPQHASIARTARWTRRCVVGLLGLVVLIHVMILVVRSPHLQVQGLGFGMFGGAIMVLNTGLMILALAQLFLLLREVENGILFSAGVTRRLRAFALLTMLAVFASTVILPLASMLFPQCVPDAPCVRRLPINIQSLWNLVVALVFFLVARLLDEARRIEEDNRQII